MRFQKNSQVIGSMEEWFVLAPPKNRIRHWRNGRSAKELARSWFPDSGAPWFLDTNCPRVPSELAQLLALGETDVIEECEPEVESKFDQFGGPSNLDLIIEAKWRGIRTLFGIEAKADESFGTQTIGLAIDKPATPNQGTRAEQLCQSIFGNSPKDCLGLQELPYQLLTGLAGTLAESHRRRAGQAIFIVHWFESSRLDPRKVSVNEAGYARLASTLTRGGIDNSHGLIGELIGPFQLAQPTEYLPSLPFYIGMCKRNIDVLLNCLEAW
jgi:hypothetical protein